MALNNPTQHVKFARNTLAPSSRRPLPYLSAQHPLPGPRSHHSYWTQVKQLYWDGRRQQVHYPEYINELLTSLSGRYQNHAFYYACRANARAGRRGRRFSINLKLYRSGGVARATALLSITNKHLMISAWKNRLLFLLLTPSQDEPNVFLNDYLTISTTLNPLHPSRLPTTRIRFDWCEINFIVLQCF